MIVLIQNLACVGMLWAFKVPRVKTREILLCVTLFIALCAAELSLPPALQPLLIYINIPLVFGTTLPQVERAHCNRKLIAHASDPPPPPLRLARSVYFVSLCLFPIHERMMKQADAKYSERSNAGLLKRTCATWEGREGRF